MSSFDVASRFVRFNNFVWHDGDGVDVQRTTRDSRFPFTPIQPPPPFGPPSLLFCIRICMDYCFLRNWWRRHHFVFFFRSNFHFISSPFLFDINLVGVVEWVSRFVGRLSTRVGTSFPSVCLASVWWKCFGRNQSAYSGENVDFTCELRRAGWRPPRMGRFC